MWRISASPAGVRPKRVGGPAVFVAGSVGSSELSGGLGQRFTAMHPCAHAPIEHLTTQAPASVLTLASIAEAADCRSQFERQLELRCLSSSSSLRSSCRGALFRLVVPRRHNVPVRNIDNVAGAAKLAAEILGARHQPIVLISTVEGGEPMFDANLVEREIGDSVDVVTIPTGEVTYALEGLLPVKAQVFGCAARSYPPDFGADPDWRRSVLRFPDRHDVNDVIEDALAQVTFAVSPFTQSRRRWVSATVELVFGDSGNIARLDSGERAVIVADHLPPQLSLSAGLIVGGPVEGWLIGRDLSPEPADVDLARFEPGAVTLARVVKATALRARLSLHPLLPDIVLRRRDVVPGADEGANADTRVTDVVAVGQTLRVYVMKTGGDVSLSLIGANSDRQVIDSLPLLRGGPPWLREGVHAEPAPLQSAQVDTPEFDQEAPLPVSFSPAQIAPDPVDTSAHLSRLSDEVAELRGAIGRLGREVRSGTDLETLDRLSDEVASLSAELHRERERRRERDSMIARLNQELREARSARAETAAPGRRTERETWPNGEAWVRHEVTSAWAARTMASEKGQYALGEYVVGPDFVGTLETLDDGQFAKALRAVVDVATGRAAYIPARELHRLRLGLGGDDPYVERADGAKCWRVSIEANAPSARRLHYWQLPGGRIELSRVVLHDDFKP